MIRVQDLKKFFGQKKAVNGVSFTVEKGEVLGFLGPNGAGKSTTMRMITGFVPPTEGAVSVGGFDVVDDPVRAKRLIGYLPESAPGYAEMTVQSFLHFVAERPMALRTMFLFPAVRLRTPRDSALLFGIAAAALGWVSLGLRPLRRLSRPLPVLDHTTRCGV